MTAVWLLVRATVRRRCPALAALAVLIGLAGGVVLTAAAGAALLVGMPAGLLADRWAWRLFATSAGVSPAAQVPVLVVLLVLPATLAAGVAIAASREPFKPRASNPR